MEQSYEAIILGGGKGGKTLALNLGKRGIKTALVERSAEMIGGSCINVACIPTKTFIACAKAAQASRISSQYGVHHGETSTNWLEVRTHVEAVVRAMRAMNEKNFREPATLNFILGAGHFVGPHTLEVTGIDGQVQRLQAPKIFINTGTVPAWPDIPGLESIAELALDSTSIQRLESLPVHLLIMGGGYIALEFAQLFRRLGSRVTVIERGPQLLSHQDVDVSSALTEVLRGEEIEIILQTTVESVARDPLGAISLTTKSGGEQRTISGSHLLVAVGRNPVTAGLNLEAAGVDINNKGYVTVNDRLETTTPGIWAIGDVAGSPQYTHASLDDSRILLTNIFDAGNRNTTDRLMPSALFTDPELASVGMTEKEARAKGFEVRVASVPASVVPRAKTTGHTQGLMKAVVDAKTNLILGCTLFAESGGESISTVQMAMLARMPYTALRDAILTHPTMTEGLNLLFSAL